MDELILYIKNGGVFMYPIIGCSIWGLTLIVERAIFHLRAAGETSRHNASFFATLSRDGITAARAECIGQKSLLQKIMFAALDNSQLTAHQVEQKMHIILVRHLPEYSRYLNLLSMLSAIMPILGLLGTVTGMIEIFHVIALQGTGEAKAMAGGLAEALITTQAGLVAAVPIIMGHILISNRMKKTIHSLHDSCNRVLDLLRTQHGR